jgi:uncharacterized RDD family membrane protein YckC
MPWQDDARTASSRLLPPGLVFSDTPSRAVAYVLDALVVGALNAFPFAVLGLFDFSYTSFPDRNRFVFGELIGFAIVFLYFVWFWTGGRRATPGQYVFGIQVANAFDGRPLSTRQGIKRWLGLGTWLGIPMLLPFMAVGVIAFTVGTIWALIVLITTIASPTKQGIHDRLAGSALVRPARAGNGWAVGCLAIVVIFFIAEGLAFIVALTQTPSTYMPSDYWDRYLRWFWPS